MNMWPFGYVSAFVNFLEAAKQCNMPEHKIEAMKNRFIDNIKRGGQMIELQEKEDNTANPDCTFLDHIVWLRRVFLRARAESSGDKFNHICKVHDDLDQILMDLFGGENDRET